MFANKRGVIFILWWILLGRNLAMFGNGEYDIGICGTLLQLIFEGVLYGGNRGFLQ